MEKTVEITVSEYNSLLESAAILRALQNGGVDNWDWYSDSISDHFEEPEYVK